MNSLTIYLTLGAVIAGLSLGSKAEGCGHFNPVDPLKPAALAALITVSWPAYFTAAVFYDFKTGPVKCDPPITEPKNAG